MSAGSAGAGGSAVRVDGLRKALRRPAGARGRLVRGRPGHAVRPARPERRGQDHDRRDPRGLPARRRRDGQRPGAGPGARRTRPPAAHRADAPGGRDRQPVRRRARCCGSTPACSATRRTPTRCSRRWTWAAPPAPGTGACPAASDSAWRWRWRWWAGPSSSSSTSRPRAWTRRRSRRPASGSRRCATTGPRSCSRPTSWATSSGSRTRWRCWTGDGSWRAARPPS